MVLLVGMCLLVTVQGYQHDNVAVFPPIRMVLVDVFPVMDAFPTERAHMLLCAGKPLFPGREVGGFRRRPFGPVGCQTGVVWRVASRDQHMPSDFEPLELEQVAS